METPKTLYEIYDLVERIARSVPNVNTFTETFESLNAEDTEYSAVVLQFRDGTQPSDGFVRYRFYLGYADRVNDQGSDKIKIQSVAEQTLRTIINKVNQDVEIEYGTFTPFEQRFTALTTGGYVECSCTLAVSDCNYETSSVLRNGKVTITENGTTTVVPTAGVDGFKQVEVTTDVHELFYDLDGTLYQGSIISKFPDNMRFGARTGTNAVLMFSSCGRLTTVPLFDTSSVTTMSSMFTGCKNLTTVPLFDTSSVTNMSGMFSYCSNLTTVPLFDTSSVTTMTNMFFRCVSLTTVPLFDTSSVTNMNNMFNGCNKLTNLGGFKNLGVAINLSASILITEESMVNVFNNLATVTTSQTLTLGSTNLAKLTDEEKAIATGKGWTLK